MLLRTDVDGAPLPDIPDPDLGQSGQIYPDWLAVLSLTNIIIFIIELIAPLESFLFSLQSAELISSSGTHFK